MPVVHSGNSHSSEEEGEVLSRAYGCLIGQSFRDRDGNERRITEADILVVTPYNARVNLLKRMLPSGARVGTVDKFQGQEAPVASSPWPPRAATSFRATLSSCSA